MAALCFLIATVLAAVVAFGSTNPHLLPAAIAFLGAGLLLQSIGVPTFTIGHRP